VLVCFVARFCLLAGASGSRFVGSTEMGVQIIGVGKHWARQSQGDKTPTLAVRVAEGVVLAGLNGAALACFTGRCPVL
jgi:hypothetical protein